MLRSSDAVVVGVVEDVTLGRIAGAEGEAQFRFRDVHVRVEEVLSGQADGSVVVEELGYAGEVPVSLNGSRWANVGDRALMALVNTTGESAGPYRLTSSQTRFFLTSTGDVEDNYLPDAVPEDTTHDAFVESLASKTVDELLAEIRGVASTGAQ